MAARPGQENLPIPQHLAQLVKDAIPPIHPEARRFVAVPLVAVVAGWRWPSVRVLGLATAAAVALFFRNPDRVPPTEAGSVVAPADGEVTLVDEAVPPAELGLGTLPLPRVSIFLSVLDVHVQRAPVAGTVAHIAYQPGEFLPADVADASTRNERSSMRIETADGVAVGVVQIAGLVARRILCEVAEGDELALGQTYGLIRFGSRVDTYLPAGTELLVRVGQRAMGAETLLARLP
ncbi:MAG TPA: phosphatidylserine decarboxylase [Propionibacteriaceae bacterium]|nr:phosphatidylserine decarboxylase [Propionibacteriaceae bacterium]